MNAVEYVLEGLEQWLEVERECGVRALEVDRTLLRPPAASPAPAAETKSPVDFAPARPTATAADSSAAYDFVFLHDKPLAPAGVEMMAKIVTAMGRTAETAPVVVEPPLPQASAYVVLGAMALRKFFPDVKGEPGQWIKTLDGKDTLITYSPAFILRFPTVTDAVKKMKRDMWNSLKSVMQRFNGGRNGK